MQLEHIVALELFVDPAGPATPAPKETVRSWDSSFREPHATGLRSRRAIIARLAKGEASVLELAQPFDMSQPAISKHIKAGAM